MWSMTPSRVWGTYANGPYMHLEIVAKSQMDITSLSLAILDREKSEKGTS